MSSPTSGAGGGVGLAAIDVAKSLGARVLAVASTEEKRALAKNRHCSITARSRVKRAPPPARSLPEENAGST